MNDRFIISVLSVSAFALLVAVGWHHLTVPIVAQSLRRPAVSAPETHVCGPILSDHWTLAGSPYVVTCDAAVVSGTLQIDPGVVVRFERDVNLDVSAALIARGTGDNPIVFTANSDAREPGYWGSLRFRSGSDGSILRHAAVEFGKGISVEHASPQIEYAQIRYHAAPGISLLYSRSTVRHSTIVNNVSAVEGGGIFIRYGQPQLAYNAIAANTAIAGGGGVSAQYSTVTFTSNWISSNRAGVAGGGVYVAHGAYIFEANTVTDNHAVARGGGIDAAGWTGTGHNDTTLIVRGSIISNNVAESYCGGGILVDAADGQIADSIIAANMVSVGPGGGICAGGSETPDLIIQGNSILTNTADVGGGIWTDALVTISGNLVTGNHARQRGGGLSYQYPAGVHGPSARPVTCNAFVFNTGPTDAGNGVYSTVLSPFHNNTIYGNDGYQVAIGSTSSVDATFNFWGTTDGKTIRAGILDRWNGGSTLGVVTYEPFLTGPSPCAPRAPHVPDRTTYLPFFVGE